MVKDIKEICSVLGFEKLTPAQRRHYIEFASDVLSEIDELSSERVELNSVQVQEDGSLKLVLAVYVYDDIISNTEEPAIHVVSYESKPVPF